jgi:hypothetical protein
LRQIVSNSGTEGAIVVAKIRENDNPNFGFNAQTDTYEDLNLGRYRPDQGDPLGACRTRRRSLR